MTEREWLACEDPGRMLEFLACRVSERKLRLLCSACCRRIWHLLEADILRNAVDALERFADGRIDEESFRAIAAETHPIKAYRDELWSRQVRNSRWWPAYGIHGVMHGRVVARERLVTREQIVFATLRLGIQDVTRALDFFARAASDTRDDPRGGERHCITWEAECAAQTDLIRELFGNACPAAPLDPACLTWSDRTIVKLAAAIYEERELPAGTLDSSPLPILADALEEANCTDDTILSHLRGPGPHVRGCWVIDLILGRG
jgi:hypothetical protein